MKNLKFFGTIFILLFLINNFSFSCNQGTKKNTSLNITDTMQVVYEDYSKKLKPLIPYLKQNKQKVASSKCFNVFVFFTNKCNACTKSALEEVWLNIKRNKSDMPIVVLNREDKIMQEIVQQKLKNINHLLLIDSNQYLEKNGLSFLKNINAKICNDSLMFWKFY